MRFRKIDWSDNELLLRVIEQRFLASRKYKEEPEELWERYFCDSVAGVPIKTYLLEHILPRPRDLLFFVKSALSMAVNRKHTRVGENDVLDAEKEYS